jgi:hypothetical protein
MGGTPDRAMRLSDNPLDSTRVVTSKGLRISFGLKRDGGVYLAYLRCQRRRDKHLLCVCLTKPDANRPYYYTRCESDRLEFVSPEEVKAFKHSPIFVQEPGDRFAARSYWEAT